MYSTSTPEDQVGIDVIEGAMMAYPGLVEYHSFVSSTGTMSSHSNVNLVVSGSTTTRAKGRLGMKDVRRVVGEDDETRCVVCGPPGYVREVVGFLRRCGVEDARILVLS